MVVICAYLASSDDKSLDAIVSLQLVRLKIRTSDTMLIVLPGRISAIPSSFERIWSGRTGVFIKNPDMKGYKLFFRLNRRENTAHRCANI